MNNNIHSTALISRTSTIGKNVTIDAWTILKSNVIIEDNVTIGPFCIIGENITRAKKTNNPHPSTLIGKNSLIRSHSVIYQGVRLSKSVHTGHNVIIREFCNIGKKCSIGSNSDIQESVNIDDYSRIHSSVIISKHAQIGKYVFIYPFTVLTEDPSPPSSNHIAPRVGDYAQIAVSSIILPGVIIGKHSIVGAGSIVTKDVEPYTKVFGQPAKTKEKIYDLWPKRYDKGMPWEGISYDTWLKQNAINE